MGKSANGKSGEEQTRRRDGQHKTHRVFVAIGSNIDPEYNVREAVRRLASRCRLLAVSPVYETAPVGGDWRRSADRAHPADQPNFMNAAALIETDLAAAELKAQVLQVIEQELGRVRTADKNAPRTIDLDITLFDDQVLDVGRRHIPDPDLLKYPHIAVPLADLAPQYRHPETGQTLQEIAERLPAGGLVRRTNRVLEGWPRSVGVWECGSMGV
jgi:2-amino-4-hydroxy-6-hydroxymethyldihydropteridine diphosphokinase